MLNVRRCWSGRPERPLISIEHFSLSSLLDQSPLDDGEEVVRRTNSSEARESKRFTWFRIDTLRGLNTPLRLFISSTFRDLRPERDAAKEALLRSELVPWGMEMFV